MNNFFFPLLSAIICSLAVCASFAANPKSQGAKSSPVDERTLTFPKVANFGTLSLIPHDRNAVFGAKSICTASGTVKVRVPKGQWLSLDLSQQAFAHPDLLDSCSETGLDALNINFLSMDDSEIGWCDKVLQQANHFKNLKCLIVSRSDVSDAGMSALSGQHDLECICGFVTRIEGDCFKTFAQYKNLQHVDFFDNAIKEDCLRYLSQCPKLAVVDLRRTHMGNLGVQYLSRCPNITILRLGGNRKIDDACIKYLLKLKHVNWLDLGGTRVTFEGLKALKPMNLQRLTVVEGICSVKDMPVLKSLAKQLDNLPQSDSGGDKQYEQMLQPMH